MATAEPTFMNSSGYIFSKIDAIYLPVARMQLLKVQREEHPTLTGTILIAEEGANIRLSGTPLQVSSFKSLIDETLFPNSTTSIANYKDVPSSSSAPSLPRFLVKIKNHLIKFPVPMGSSPVASHINSSEMKDLLSQGATLLDTRNDYEYKLGKFKGAKTIDDLKTFQELPSKMKDITFPSAPTQKHNHIIMYCTGGIRCEKAQYMDFPPNTSLYQLDGGVLKYFEENPDGELWDGGLFVFDERKCVNPRGEIVPVDCCFKCRFPVERNPAQAEKGAKTCQECGYDDFYNTRGEKRRRSTGKKRTHAQTETVSDNPT
ncbi:hypothetical protein TrST_g13791 [Triparma strigata]|uniref:Rhodanese domain-containing protein n=1 Tax=Triparma strigata TaxID=1606541 RepID=A0A9W7E9Z8_9STRA|nr:hypothetical protein TrST_g13791 [Triparma strigata]